MNTKQLYNALTLNAYTNKYFDGIYSIDTLKDINENPELIICNTDPSDCNGANIGGVPIFSLLAGNPAL